MNHKYKKHPITIEAFKMTTETRWDNKDWPNWLNQAWQKEPHELGSVFINPEDETRNRLSVRSLEGVMSVSWGDWIVRGIEEELYVVRSGIFEKLYEEA